MNHSNNKIVSIRNDRDGHTDVRHGDLYGNELPTASHGGCDDGRESRVTRTNLNAGYTYLGQFISHEIVRATHPPPGTTHVASPVLDLDSLYGSTQQEMDSYLVNGRFPIAANASGVVDLRRVDGVAQIPDQRNDDNVIISQLHLFMQRFHNFTIEQQFAADAAEARRLVTLVFQLLVVEDFLRQVLAPSVFDSYFRFDRRWLDFKATEIPPEFALAGFRFGHSMVRPTYAGFPRHPKQLVEIKEVPLADLFHAGKNLDPTLAIDWHKFFGWPGPADPELDFSARAQNASRIDHSIVTDMRAIGGPGGEVDIVCMNLNVGLAAGLPNGALYAERVLMGAHGAAIEAALALAPLRSLHRPDPFANAGLDIGDLPLWPYILVEAFQASEGAHLGVLGSMICAEVLANAIAAAPTSIHDGRWPSVDEVLADIGPLGDALQEQRRAAAIPGSAFTGRTFCMRHLIDLVLG